MMQSKPEERKLDTLENVCTDLLEGGFVQSFVDLFYISHKCLPNVMETQNYFGHSLHVPEYQFFYAGCLKKSLKNPLTSIESLETPFLRLKYVLNPCLNRRRLQ